MIIFGIDAAQQHQTLAAFFSLPDNLALTLDAENRITAASAGLLALIGVDERGVLGQPFTALLFDADRSAVAARLQEAREQAVLRVEILRKIVATQLAAGEVPPVIERVGVRVAADGVGEQLLASIRATLPTLGEEVHALVLGEDDAALVGNGLGQHGAQVGTFESQ